MRAVAAAGGNLCPVGEDQQKGAVRASAHALDALLIDNYTTTDAKKFAGTELRFHFRYGAAAQVTLSTTMDAHIVVGGLDPVDFVGRAER